MRQKGVTAIATLALLFSMGIPSLAKTTIRYFGAWGTTIGPQGASDYDFMEQLLDEFMAKNPDVEVEWENSSAAAKMATYLAAGTAPDVAYVLQPNMGYSFAAQGAFLDLTPYMKRDAAEVKAQDFFPGMLNGLTYQDKLYGLPTWVASSGLYYNKHIFDEAGIRYPDQTWTWNDLVVKGKKLLRADGDGKITHYAYTPDGYDFNWSTGPTIWVWSNGADLLDETRTKFTLGSPAARQALESYEDIIFKQNISINPQLNAQQRWWTRFFNGTVAIWDSPSWNNTYLSNVEYQWDIAPTLSSPYTGKRGAFLDTRGHGILASSKNPEIAWRLVKFLSSPDVQARWAQYRGYQPSRYSAARAWLEFRPGNRRVNLQPFIDSIMEARYIPQIPDLAKHTAFWGAIKTTWNQVLSRQIGVSAFIDTVTPLVEDALRDKTATTK